MSRPGKAPIHLKPAAALAPRVLLPGDPHRALAMAQELLDEPLMFNHQRGLWGYTGGAPDGSPVTIQSTGMGGPSAALICEELVDLGATTLIRTGTCGALDPHLWLGATVAAAEVIPDDGASVALGAGERVLPDEALTAALLETSVEGVTPERAIVVSSDLFYDDRPGQAERWEELGARAVDMEAAAVLTLAARRGVRAACLLAVADLLSVARSGMGTERLRIDPALLDESGVRLGRIALEALARVEVGS
jgi:purine-nucleoside phosphorylase